MKPGLPSQAGPSLCRQGDWDPGSWRRALRRLPLFGGPSVLLQRLGQVCADTPEVAMPGAPPASTSPGDKAKAWAPAVTFWKVLPQRFTEDSRAVGALGRPQGFVQWELGAGGQRQQCPNPFFPSQHESVHRSPDPRQPQCF